MSHFDDDRDDLWDDGPAEDDVWDQGPAPAGPPLGRGGGRTAPPPQRLRSGGGGRGRGRGTGRGPRILLGVVITGLLVVGALGVWVQRQIDPSGAAGAPQTISIPAGATSSKIGQQLADDGIISSAFVWDWYLRINGGGPFEAGDYELGDNSSMGEVVKVLQRGPRPPDERGYTMPEGFTVKETLARLASPSKGLGLDAAALQQLLDSGQVRSQYQPTDVTSSEGILFPETYRVEADADGLAVLQQMVDELDSTLTALHVETAQEEFNLTPYEILVTASLIEEETKVPEERAMVARVIYNRLKQGIPLGIDATSRYEAELAGRDRSKVDFTSTSPFNTRKVKGLPPTPIASPGRASIEAALHPADGTWIYYVLRDAQGHHTFTDSAAEFSRAKQKCHDAGLGCG